MDQPGRHPYFDDRGAAPWFVSLEAGLLAARAAGRRVALVVSRPDCGGSRALIERVMPKEEIAEALQARFICVSADARAPGAAVEHLLSQLPKREPTPVCIYLDAEGLDAEGLADRSPPRVLHSTAGGRPPAVFLRDLTEALAKR
jgi:hypothetical protein